MISSERSLSVAERRAKLLTGNEEKIQQLHKNGRFTARERINKLMDEASFVELDVFASHRAKALGMAEVQAPGEGVVTGFGTVDGRPVYVYAQDVTVLGGSVGEVHAKKIAKVYDLAVKTGSALVAILDSTGARIEEGVHALNAYGEVIARSARASGVIPQIALLLGTAAGSGAMIPVLSDFVITVKKDAALFTTSAQVLAAQNEQAPDAAKIGGAKVLGENGLAHLIAEDEATAIDQAKHLLALLPSNNLEESPFDLDFDDLNRTVEGIDSLADVRERIAQLADRNQMIELQQEFGTDIITALIRLGGRSIGVIANCADKADGRITSDALKKATRFVRTCDAFSIPLLVLTDTVGLEQSIAAEAQGIAADAAKLAYAFAEATVPVVNFICGSAIGAGYLVMASRALGADAVYAWPQAQIAPMTAQSAAVLLYRSEVAGATDPIAKREELAQEYAQVFAGPFAAAEGGYVDDVVEPDQTRRYAINALEMLQSKRETRLPKKHGNLPL